MTKYDPYEPCAVDGCDNLREIRAWCGMHYARWHKHGSTDMPVRRARLCTVKGCTRKHIARGLCMTHYQRNRRALLRLAPSDLPAQ